MQRGRFSAPGTGQTAAKGPGARAPGAARRGAVASEAHRLWLAMAHARAQLARSFCYGEPRCCAVCDYYRTYHTCANLRARAGKKHAKVGHGSFLSAAFRNELWHF